MSPRSLTSVITVESLKHENNTLGIRLYLSNSSITTEQGVNTTSSVPCIYLFLNHPAHKAKQAGWGEAVPARMCHGKSRQLLNINIFQLKKYLHPCYIVRTAAMVRGSNNCQLSVAVYNLPPELCEIIYKEYLE